MFNWIKQRRRRRLLAQPFPEAWLGSLRANVRHYAFLRPAQQETLRRKTAVFIAEKTWIECGQAIDDEVKVSLAGQACVMLIGLEADYCFDEIRSVFVYPGSKAHPLYVERWDLCPGARYSGEAWARGPLVLPWSHALAGARGSRDGRNLVVHELAHHLDQLDGELDGVPPFADRADRERWVDEYLRLSRGIEPPEVRLLGEYRVPSEADFFAVATECFFQRPGGLKRAHGAIYELLARFYRQDAAATWPEVVSEEPEAVRTRLAEQELSYEQSVQECVRRMRLTEATGDANFAEGTIHMEHGRAELALACYDQAIERAPHDGEAYWHRAACRLELGQALEALADCEEAIRLEPNDLEGYRTRGRAWRALKQFDRSIEDFNTVVDAEHGDADAFYQRGLTHAEAERQAEAIADYTAAINRLPTRAEYYVARCKAYHTLGLDEQAEADRQEAMRRDPRLRGD